MSPICLSVIRFNGAALRRERRGRGSEDAHLHRPFASMGPLSEESGEFEERPQKARRSTGFNGAALRRERRGTQASTRGSTSRSFNGAALRRERRGTSSRLRRRRRSCFNGAALRRERREVNPGTPGPFVDGASMGPLSEESGEHRRGRDASRDARAASMGPLSEESGEEILRLRLLQHHRCFNGAALRRERRAGENPVLEGTLTELLWGRSPKRAERWRARAPLDPTTRSSFNGAALRRERRDDVLNRPPPCSVCFNGAALRRERRGLRMLPRKACKHVEASMGPLSEESGESSMQRPGKIPD